MKGISMDMRLFFPSKVTPLAAQVIADANWHDVALAADCVYVKITVTGATAYVVPQIGTDNPAQVGTAYLANTTHDLIVLGNNYLEISGNGATVTISQWIRK